MLNSFGPILPGLRNTTTVVITYPSDRRPWTTELTTSRGHDVFYQSQCSANWYGRDWEERSHALSGQPAALCLKYYNRIIHVIYNLQGS